jgi:hypothetical protein
LLSGPLPVFCSCSAPRENDSKARWRPFSDLSCPRCIWLWCVSALSSPWARSFVPTILDGIESPSLRFGHLGTSFARTDPIHVDLTYLLLTRQIYATDLVLPPMWRAAPGEVASCVRFACSPSNFRDLIWTMFMTNLQTPTMPYTSRPR